MSGYHDLFMEKLSISFMPLGWSSVSTNSWIFHFMWLLLQLGRWRRQETLSPIHIPSFWTLPVPISKTSAIKVSLRTFKLWLELQFFAWHLSRNKIYLFTAAPVTFFVLPTGGWKMVGIEYIEEYHIYLHNTCSAHFKLKV